MPDDVLTVVAKPNPLQADVVYTEMKSGQTIMQMLGAGVSDTANVTINGDMVPRQLWAHVKPKAGTQINVLLYPQGGNARKWIAIVIMVAVTILTYGATSGWFATAGGTFAAGSASAAALAAGISIVGTLVINALIAPPTPKGLSGSGDPFQQLQSITGTSNQANPYGAVPCVVGTMRYFPPHAALPYTEISGDDQYLRMLLDLGYGEFDVSDIQIGGTPIEQFHDVEYEVSVNPTIFSQDIYEASVGIPLNTSGDTAMRTTQTATTEISLDLIGANGVFGVSAEGDTVKGTIGFSVVYRATGSTGSWLPVGSASGLTLTNGLASTGGPSISLTSGARKTYRGGIRWKVPTGQYDVSVTRATAKGIGFPGSLDVNSVSDSIAWSVLRSVSPQVPSTTGTTKLAVRIKASDQLNGVVQNLSVLLAQKIGMWDKANGVWLPIAETQNPAWIYAWLLTRCPAIVRRLADDRVDLDGIADWADECAAKGLVCSFVMDSARALIDVLRDVLAAGRASFGLVDGKYGAVRDKPQTVPVQMFTPSNSWGFSYSRVFSDLPHALRVKFINPEANYQQDERLVYADGYTAANATIFEEIDMRMVTDPDAAWKLGRYHLAVAYNRPNTYTLNADIENLVCERGDLVRVAHDITEWGNAWGRIKAVSTDGKTVTLDGPVDLAASTTYKLQVRKSDGTQAAQNVTSAAANNVATITIAATTGAAVGDLWVLGEINRGTADLIVRAVSPSDDLTAELTLVDAAPAVLTADSGTPPAFVSTITGQAWCDAPDPPQLNLIVTGTRNDSGAFNQGGGISIPPQPGILRGGAGGGGGTVRGRRAIGLL